MKSLKRALALVLPTLLLAFLLLVIFAATVRSADAKRLTTHELWVGNGEYFQVVCNYPGAQIVYGGNGVDGVIGVCQ